MLNPSFKTKTTMLMCKKNPDESGNNKNKRVTTIKSNIKGEVNGG